MGPWLRHPTQPRPPFYPAGSPCPDTPKMAKSMQEERGGQDSKEHGGDLWGTCSSSVGRCGICPEQRDGSQVPTLPLAWACSLLSLTSGSCPRAPLPPPATSPHGTAPGVNYTRPLVFVSTNGGVGGNDRLRPRAPSFRGELASAPELTGAPQKGPNGPRGEPGPAPGGPQSCGQWPSWALHLHTCTSPSPVPCFPPGSPHLPPRASPAAGLWFGTAFPTSPSMPTPLGPWVAPWVLQAAMLRAETCGNLAS